MQTLQMFGALGAVLLGWPLSTMKATFDQSWSHQAPTASDRHEVFATISEIKRENPETVRLALAHPQIVHLGLPAMTTYFRLSPSQTPLLSEGQRVEVTIEKSGGQLAIAMIRPAMMQAGEHFAQDTGASASVTA